MVFTHYVDAWSGLGWSLYTGHNVHVCGCMIWSGSVSNDRWPGLLQACLHDTSHNNHTYWVIHQCLKELSSIGQTEQALCSTGECGAGQRVRKQATRLTWQHLQHDTLDEHGDRVHMLIITGLSQIRLHVFTSMFLVTRSHMIQESGRRRKTNYAALWGPGHAHVHPGLACVTHDARSLALYARLTYQVLTTSARIVFKFRPTHAVHATQYSRLQSTATTLVGTVLEDSLFSPHLLADALAPVFRQNGRR